MRGRVAASFLLRRQMGQQPRSPHPESTVLPFPGEGSFLAGSQVATGSAVFAGRERFLPGHRPHSNSGSWYFVGINYRQQPSAQMPQITFYFSISPDGFVVGSESLKDLDISIPSTGSLQLVSPDLSVGFCQHLHSHGVMFVSLCVSGSLSPDTVHVHCYSFAVS